MAKVYTTVEGDVLDQVCYQHYGQSDTVTEAVLLLNPSLSKYGEVLPAGVEILLPDVAVESVVQTKRLWD